MFDPAFLPVDVGVMHFIGIGGIGMSGMAEIMHKLGYVVQGSDQKQTVTTDRLEREGIRVFIGHDLEQVKNARFVIYSTAIPRNNPELAYAIQHKKYIVKRAEMLGELMRHSWSVAIAGSHGKTTTTSLAATILRAANYDPTVINGGVINAQGVNAWLGKGKWIVTEADESDGSFLRIPSTVGVVTNIDPEHLDYYGSLEKVERAFETFLSNIPFYGIGVGCIDHSTVRRLLDGVTDRRVISYGFCQDAMVRAYNVRTEGYVTLFDVEFRDREEAERGKSGRTLQVRLPLLGTHNVQNALAAIGVADELGIKGDVITESLAGFKGVKRRFTLVGEVGGIRFIDDYAHHPVEIMATISSARLVSKKQIVVVFEPHRYSRVLSLYDGFMEVFKGVKCVLVSPVYPAGENPLSDVNEEQIAKDLMQNGTTAYAFDNPQDLPPLLTSVIDGVDIVLFLGAGSVSSWAASICDDIALYLGRE